MKKFLCIILSIVCLLGLTSSLVACGGNSDSETSGLKYELQDDGTYFVTGIETETENIIIPSQHQGKNVSGIAKEAFEADRTLKNVTLPSSVYVIEKSAFYNCSALKTINLNNVSIIEETAFRNTKLSSVSFEQLQSIGRNAFNGCVALKTLTFPAGVSEIGQSAFSGCSLLNTVTFNGNVNIVGENAFSGCSLLKNINLDKVKYFKEGSFQSCVSLESINLANAVEIETKAFSGCNKLTSVVLGANLIYIHKDAMKGSGAIASVEVVNKEGWFNVGTCAGCAITEWPSLRQASSFEDPANNVSTFVASNWTHNQYLCKQDWVKVNRPNGWNVNKTSVYCDGCRNGG